MGLKITDQGPAVEAVQHHVANKPFPTQVPGEHLWIVAGMWRVADPAKEKVFLAMENLLNIDGPGCLWCEQHYTPELAAQRCRGGS